MYAETAHTAAYSPSGAGFLANKTAAGYWQHHAVVMSSSADGAIDIRVGSNFTGAIYETEDNDLYDSSEKLSPNMPKLGQGSSFVSWMIAGLLVQTLD